ncbi:MAG: hypothetical protein KF812_12165 [Fimbriimonadaceae bacterium]|nr:hypothetical protein [Fimbriimonadaceae bacterium]
MYARNLVVCVLAVICTAANADIITTTPLQVGGFYDEGISDNAVDHQNYFVGYGTTAGFGRTNERRSFFWYHIPDFEGEVVDVSIKLEMLFPTSLIFGLGEIPPAKDPVEAFQLGATDVPAELISSPGLSMAESQFIFDSLDDHPIAEEYEFLMSESYTFPFIVEIHLDASGLDRISMGRGGDVVLSGWMPTWSYDDRIDPVTGEFLESSELLFGFSDVPSLVPPPELTITTMPVPEPTAMAATLLGIAGLLMKGRKAKT